ncbi:hypothetical protein BJ742DRAFT_738257 [Cladochytrium replicatum]|nr:hypothetical protein BJ742DRAFT_738257 [Cladochytrium replicatum]
MNFRETEAKVVLVFEKVLNLDDDAFDSLPDESFPVYGELSGAIFHTTRSTAPVGDTNTTLATLHPPPVPPKDAPKETTRGGLQEMEDKWMDIVRNWIDQFHLEDKAREITPSVKNKIKEMMHGVHTGLADQLTNPNGINGGARSEEDRHWNGSKEDLKKMRQQQEKEKAEGEAQQICWIVIRPHIQGSTTPSSIASRSAHISETVVGDITVHFDDNGNLLRAIHFAQHRNFLKSVRDDLSLTQTFWSGRRGEQSVFQKPDAPISEGGVNLRVGQCQLMCLARAILKEPRILVMDGANKDPLAHLFVIKGPGWW